MNETNGGRLIAIGDVHGHAQALSALLALVEPGPSDTVVTLGDYVDRGPDSRGVLDILLGLPSRCRLVALMGNHEEMMLDARRDDRCCQTWLVNGGHAALKSYGENADIDSLPSRHWEFLERLPTNWETDEYLFAHANYAANFPWPQQHSQMLLWLDLADRPGPHYSGKVAIVGHTPQRDRRPLNLGYLRCIDTGCGMGGVLTALEVRTGETWQVDELGAPYDAG